MNIIWNSRKLAEALHAGAVSERQKFAYFFIIFFLMTLGATETFHAFMAAPANDYTYASDAIYIAAFVVGTLLVFGANQSGDGKGFIERAICLSLPIFLQIIVILLVAYFALGLYDGLTQEISEDQIPDSLFATQPSAADVVITATVEVYYYYRMILSMRIASGTSKAKTIVPS